MDINKCPNCQKQFDQDKRLAKQLPCGCFSCLKCYKTVFQLVQEIRCKIHQQVYNVNPEELQDYVVQQQVQLQNLPQAQEEFIDQEQIAYYIKQLQDQYVKKQNHNREILKEIQDSSQFFQHIQSLAIKEILKILIHQFSMSKDKIKSLLNRLSALQVANEVFQQQQQNQRVNYQDSHERQNRQSQLQYQFQQIMREIDELKKEQWMDIQNLRVNVQRCMFNMFVYLSENCRGQLLSDRIAELLVQKYFKQFKIIRGLSQVSSSLVQQKIQLQSQNIEKQLSQEIQRDDQQQYQSQVSDKQQGQDIVQVNQGSVSQELSLQERQVNDARVMFQQMEQK